MAPLALSAVTKNGTLKRNETAPPKITIQGRQVGGLVQFSCPQGFTLQGAAEATCQQNGDWSAAIPLCKGKFIRNGFLKLLRAHGKKFNKIFNSIL